MYIQGKTYKTPDLADPQGQGVVPHLTGSFTGYTEVGDAMHYRQRFQAPASAGSLRIYPFQKTARRGEKAAFALIPDRGCSALGPFSISLKLPQGLEPVPGTGMRWSAPGRELSWNLSPVAQSCALHLESVLENQGAEAPQTALGPWRTGRNYLDKRKNDGTYWVATGMNSGSSIWYKLSAVPFQDGPSAPSIVGVSFQSQIYPGGGLGDVGDDRVEDILFNYSVDGSQQGALLQDVNLSRFGGAMAGGPEQDDRLSSADTWINGYHVADADRAWTWKDLNALKVHLQARQHGPKHRNKLLSLIASVRYYSQSAAMPRLFLQVTEAAHKTLPLSASFYGLGQAPAGSGQLNFEVNP
jgi:hypothetical protein